MDYVAEVRRRWQRRSKVTGDFLVTSPSADVFRVSQGIWIKAHYSVRDGVLRYDGMPRGSIDALIQAHFIWGCPDARIVTGPVPDHLVIEWAGKQRFETPRRFRGWRLHIRENVQFLDFDSDRPITIQVKWHTPLWRVIGFTTHGDGNETVFFSHAKVDTRQSKGQHFLGADFDLKNDQVVRLARMLPSIRRTAQGIFLDDRDIVHLKMMMESV